MAKRVSLKGKGADLFFGDYPAPRPPAPADEADGLAPETPGSEPDGSRPPSPAETAGDGGRSATPAPQPAAPPGAHPPRRPATRSAEASEQASPQTIELASVLASTEPEAIETIRRVVKTPGREVSFVRLTPKEKEQLADVVYTYKRQGVKTTETEVNRIAINSLLADYRANGERSILARVLAALQA